MLPLIWAKLRQLEIVAEATDGESAVELANQVQPDVVLLDVGLPGIGGVEACRQIKVQHPDLPVLILTSHSQKSLIEQLIGAGASDFCLKGIEAESLILALQSVAVGASWWDKRSSQEIRAAYTLSPRAVAVATNDMPLTQREQEILSLMAHGQSNQEIAQQLHITTGTVRVHVHAILQKLDVRDRAQAAIFALQQGLVESKGV
ncbi:MAG: DNA-binding response regulator [Phormidesmis priestleyi]|uniref:DNA-binding response regulator n=1 Tax=Phormidesmis priestleyi TaxID=268141 RepID=A0A2W4WQ79_9CYAN|nr:MAG: DNA-binding response regulator [Phormidesmis priestleyi]